MDDQIIFIILALAIWILRAVFSNKDKRQPAPKANRPAKSKPKKKSFQDIVEELIKEATGEKETATTKPATQPVLKHTSKIEKQKEQLNWQQVDRTKLADKSQLIYHEDYHDVHKNENTMPPDIGDNSIAKSEGKVYHFDVKKINWKDAVIAKEILDRKYV